MVALTAEARAAAAWAWGKGNVEMGGFVGLSASLCSLSLGMLAVSRLESHAEEPAV